MRTTMRDMAVGEHGRVIGFSGINGAYREKLLVMGVTPGATFKVQRVAPLGDPMEIRVRGFALSLRKRDAESITVEKMPG